MKVIVAGSRTITDYDKVVDALYYTNFSPREIVSGGAPGVDKLGEQYAIECTLGIKVFPADWEKHGRSAGFIRNKQMAEYADALIAVWDGKSRGTENMIRCMLELKKPIYIHFV
jgi:YspA, cpYpsA-related SLOG family